MRYIHILLFLLLHLSAGAQIISNFPYVDDFEGQTSSWVKAPGNSNIWERSTPAKAILNSAYSGSTAWITNDSFNYSNNRLDFFQSPLFNFSSLNDAPYLRFKLNMKTESCCDYLKIQYTLDDQNWVDFGDHNTGQNWFNDNNVIHWSGNSGGWIIVSHKLDALPQSQNVRFRFLFFSDYSQNDEGIAIDDFEIMASYTDASLKNLINPLSSACDFSNSENVSLEIANLGQNALSGITVSYQLNNSSVVTENVPQIPADTSSIYTFSQGLDLSADTSYNLRVWINAPGDNYSLNDTLEYVITNLNEISQFPYSEDFESGAEEWFSEGENNSWSLGEPTKSKIRGAASGQNAWVTGNTGFGLYNNNEASYVMSPCFNTSALNSAQIRLKAWWESENNYDGANLQYSTDDGQNWMNLNNTSSTNGFNNSQISGLAFTGSTNGWSGNSGSGTGSNGYVPVVFIDNQLAGHSAIRFRMNFGSDINTRDDGFAFDDFLLSEAFSADLATEVFAKDYFNICAGASDSLFVVIRNLGSASQSTFNLYYQIDTTTNSIAYSGTLVPGGSDTLYLGLVSNSNPGDYIVRIFHDLNSDGFRANDTTEARMKVYSQKAPPQAGNVQICDSSRALLTANGSDLIRWYSDNAYSELVFVGDTFLTGIINTDSTFYVTSSTGTIDSLGPEDRDIGNGSFTNVVSETRFEVTEFSSLLSAKIYVSNQGSFEISIENELGQTIRNRSFNISSGERRINLGFDLEPGNYVLKVHNFSGLTLYRNTSGADYSAYTTGYFSLLGNNFAPDFYYYLYDFRVSNSEPCVGESIVQVNTGNVLPEAKFTYDRLKNRFIFHNRSSSATSFRWFFENLSNGTIDSSSSIEPIVFLDSGNYRISLIAGSNCGTDTLSRNFLIDEISVIETAVDKENHNIILYPNPAKDRIYWRLENTGEKLELRVYDLMGKELFRTITNDYYGRIDLNEFEPGYYILRTRSGTTGGSKAFIVE